MRIAFIRNRLVYGQGCFVFREARVSILVDRYQAIPVAI